MKKYLQQTVHITRYNIIGGILLIPFLTMFIIDLVSRIVQGDLTRYNRPVYAYLSHTPLYWTPVLFTIAILFPALAILINLVPLIKNSFKKQIYISRLAFLKKNSITLAILVVGLGFLALIEFHDFAPCMYHGLRGGFDQLPKIISVCIDA